jgi:hypothetical protein
MWNDPIVDEVRRAREIHAKKFDYDLLAIVEDLKKQQSAGGRKFTVLPSRRPVVFPKIRAEKKK